MWMMALLLLAVIFTVSIITTFFSFPTKKLLNWFFSSFHTTTKIPDPSSHDADDDLVGTNTIIKNREGTRSTHEEEFTTSVFRTFDKNRDGFITKTELRDSLHSIGVFLTEAELCDLVEKVDSNGDGLIDINEFCQLKGKWEEKEEEEEELKDAFDVFDGNKDGLITVDELGLVLSSLGLMKQGNRLDSCKEMINKVDLDGDGMVNFHEFKIMMMMMKTRGGKKLFSVS